MQKILIHSKRENKNSLLMTIHEREGDFGLWDFTEKEFVDNEESADNVTSAVEYDTNKCRYVLTIPEGLPTGKEYDVILYYDETRETVAWGAQVFLDKTKGFIRPGEQHNLPAIT